MASDRPIPERPPVMNTVFATGARHYQREPRDRRHEDEIEVRLAPSGARLLGDARILEHERHALARADAHAEHAVAGLAQAQLGREREHVASARRAEGV